MKPLILTADEVRRAEAGTLTEIRRPVENPPRHWSEWDGLDGVTYQTGYSRIESSPTGLFIWSMDWRDPQPPRLSPFGAPGDLLFGQEEWRSWQSERDEDAGDTEDPGGVQTYVAYQATPRRGYRPHPDRAAITYLHETSPIACNPELLGPWESASLMPEWAARFIFVNRGVRAERVDGVWTWVVAVERLNRPNGAPLPPSEAQHA